MEEDKVIMSNWQKIWNKRFPDQSKLKSKNLEERFMELKRLTGNDTMKNGGIPYDIFLNQYNHLKEMLVLKEDEKSIFEVGCGSAPYLVLFEQEGFQVGGMDYAATLIEVAKNVLKAPLELYCEEALNLYTKVKYDAVFSTSAFEYFESDDYAEAVLTKMLKKAKKSLAILDVHDIAKKEEYISYRRKKMENYDELYKGLSKKFFAKDFFVDFALKHDLEIFIEESRLDTYWNQPFVFDVYYRKREWK